MVKYSICITHYNMKDTLREFMESVFVQIDSSFEVVVCDNCSDDGSREILEDYARAGKIRLLVQKSSRGKGRQIAFENSTGDYIISGLDSDDVLKPTLKDVLKIYHSEHEGYALSFGTIHFIPRPLVESVGGWRDLQSLEDVDFCKRVEILGKMHYFEDDSFVMQRRGRVKRSIFYRTKERYSYYKCAYQIGRCVWSEIIKKQSVIWYRRPIEFVLALTAVANLKIKKVKKFKYA